ncbi:phytanoyl-CoA dioxygenase [Hyaloraphidium curvatum]|nr:phytanoyl-CoA dioxygenase [Hyaloraphidium curvatum]
MARLDASQLAFYRENGYLLLPGLLTPSEAASLRAESHALIARLRSAGSGDVEAAWPAARRMKEAAPGGASVLHCHNVQFQSAALGRLLFDERWTGPVADIMGTGNVQLHHNKLFIKPPSIGSPFPVHQDYPFFPHDRHSMLAVVFHFDDAPPEKGPFRVFPGTHLRPLPHLPDGGHHLDPAHFPLDRAVPIPAKAGDVLVFSYLLAHCSGPNVSDEARTTLLVQVRDPEDRPTEMVHLSRGQGMMLRGVDPRAGMEWGPRAAPAQGGMGMGSVPASMRG